MLLLDGPLIIDCIHYIMNSERMVNILTLRLTIMILNFFFFDVHCIVIEFYLFSLIFLYQFYYKTIATLDFSSNPCFLKKNRKKIGGIDGRAGEQPRKIASQRVRVKTFVFAPTWSIA